MTSMTSATHALIVRINSGAINCRSPALIIEVVLACERGIGSLCFGLWSLVYVYLVILVNDKDQSTKTKDQILSSTFLRVPVVRAPSFPESRTQAAPVSQPRSQVSECTRETVS